jgi:hypothetical protein
MYLVADWLTGWLAGWLNDCHVSVHPPHFTDRVYHLPLGAVSANPHAAGTEGGGKGCPRQQHAGGCTPD